MPEESIYVACLRVVATDDLVKFGGGIEGAYAPDGAPYVTNFNIPRFLWEHAGSPDRVFVAFSASDLTTKLHRD